MKRTHDRVVIAGGGPISVPKKLRCNLQEWALIAANHGRTYQHLLDASMIRSLRRCGMLR